MNLRPQGRPASSPPGERDLSADRSPAEAGRAAASPRPVAALSRQLSDFLVEFSIVLHKRAMYPSGHPHLQRSLERFVDRLEILLRHWKTVSLGVARHQLIIGGVATDPRNALLSDLARRLHRHRVASIRVTQGVTLAEVNELVGALSADPKDPAGPLGLRLESTNAWLFIEVLAPELDRLVLTEEPADEEEPGLGGELWRGLAYLALAGGSEALTGEDDPLLVARAIENQIGQVAYDRVVLDYLVQLTEELSGRAGTWEPRVRERVSQLLSALRPATVRRLLEAAADHTERWRFALSASEVLAVDAVVDVLEAAAATTGQTISHHMLRLLHRFAEHSEHVGGAARGEADSLLRANVARLIANWSLEDPNPAEYTAALDCMARRPADDSGSSAGQAEVDYEPEMILKMGLETGCVGPRVYAALERMIAARQVHRAAELLHGARDPEAAEPLWRHLATPARLREELAGTPINFAAVEGLATRLGEAAVEPLLDLLESATDQSARARSLRLLVDLGAASALAAAARLPGAPWYVQRNLLILLRQLQIPPGDFAAAPYTVHPDHRVRLEAYKLLLEDPGAREAAVCRGLDDESDDVVRLALRSALEACPAEAHGSVGRLIEDRRRPAELRALAVRVLGRNAGAEAVPRLLGIAGARRGLLGWRLGQKSPMLLAAVSVLARHCPSHPKAAGVLALARRHADQDIRLAAEAHGG